jgi:hypothetical protein
MERTRAHPEGMETVTLELREDGALIDLQPGDWLVCFVPGLDRQWWHPLVHHRHKHVFAIRAEQDVWTLFEPWWSRLMVASITREHALKYLLWAARGDALLVQEHVPGRGSQLRGWMNCAALVSYLLGRRYWVWIPHELYKHLSREPRACRIDLSQLEGKRFEELVSDVRRLAHPCGACTGIDAHSADRPFCINCGRILETDDTPGACETSDAV